jgi:peroxiredoxin Q/BCP
MIQWILLAGILGMLLGGTAPAEELKPGDKAPGFELPGSDGKKYKLDDFKGKRAVVVAWFPKAFTGGCTAECKSLRASGDLVREFDVAYFAASCDTAKLNQDFAKSLDLDFPILSDPDKKTAQAYGVVDEKRPLPQRWTYYIGTDGKILHIDKQVKTESHGQDVAAKLKELGVKKK